MSSFLTYFIYCFAIFLFLLSVLKHCVLFQFENGFKSKTNPRISIYYLVYTIPFVLFLYPFHCTFWHGRLLKIGAKYFVFIFGCISTTIFFAINMAKTWFFSHWQKNSERYRLLFLYLTVDY